MTSIAKKYNGVAKIYDWILTSYTKQTIAHALNIAPLQGQEKILDVGCGTGALEAQLLPLYPNLQVDACDLSQGMIEQAKKKLGAIPNVNLMVGDFFKLDFPVAAYDTVFILSNFHYFPNPLALLQRAHQLAKPNAQLVLVTWAKGSAQSRFYEAWMKHANLGFQSIYSLDEIEHLLQKSGWLPEAYSTFTVRGFWTLFAMRAKKI